MNDVERDLKKAILICENDPGSVFDFKNHARMLGFTNEKTQKNNMGIDYNDKKVLTVCSSGDHVLNSILWGADDVDCFDINVLTKYYLDLKIAALKCLTSKEYILFFAGGLCATDAKFNSDKFSYIKELLREESLFFWDELFKRYEHNKNVISKLITSNFSLENIGYLQEDNYELLQRKIEGKNTMFIHSNLLNLPSDVNDKYDIIHLSNIPDYSADIFLGDSSGNLTYTIRDKEIARDSYVNFIRKDVDPLLRSSGELLTTSFVSSGYAEYLKKIGFYSDVKGDSEKLLEQVYVYKKAIRKTK